MKPKVLSDTGRQLTGQNLILAIVIITALLWLVTGCGSTAPPAESPSPAASTRTGVADLPPAQRADYYQAKPDMTIDPTKTYQATIQTNKGDIVVSLAAAASPEHVNNFIFLSFYNCSWV